MNEARRFLRYITPGILFAVLTFFLLWLALPEFADKIIKTCFFTKDNSVAIAIGALLASGALGYLFATIHHFCHWNLPIDQNVINHTEQIAKLRKEGFIPSLKYTPDNPRLEALTTLTILWFERLQPGGPIGNSENRAAALSDLAHAAGTARVAAACSLFTSILIIMSCSTYNPSEENVLRYIGMLVIGMAVVWLFNDSYRRTGNISQQLYDTILEHALMAESKNQKKESEP